MDIGDKRIMHVMINRTVQMCFRLLPEGVKKISKKTTSYTWYKRYAYKKYRNSVNKEGYTLTSADKLKCIFLHIPKCAGISISKALFGNLGGGHITAEEYLHIYTPQEYAEFFKFTFVRNPWSRLASAFYFIKAGGLHDGDRQFYNKHLAKYDTFEHFVLKWLTPKTAMMHQCFQPQAHFLCVEDRPLQLDFLGYFENLADDFNFVCNKLGVKTSLRFLNKTNIEYGDYRDLYTNDMIQVVEEIYSKDIALLGYAFDNSNLSELLQSRRLRS